MLDQQQWYIAIKSHKDIWNIEMQKGFTVICQSWSSSVHQIDLVTSVILKCLTGAALRARWMTPSCPSGEVYLKLSLTFL